MLDKNVQFWVLATFEKALDGTPTEDPIEALLKTFVKAGDEESFKAEFLDFKKSAEYEPAKLPAELRLEKLEAKTIKEIDELIPGFYKRRNETAIHGEADYIGTLRSFINSYDQYKQSIERSPQGTTPEVAHDEVSDTPPIDAEYPTSTINLRKKSDSILPPSDNSQQDEEDYYNPSHPSTANAGATATAAGRYSDSDDDEPLYDSDESSSGNSVSSRSKGPRISSVIEEDTRNKEKDTRSPRQDEYETEDSSSSGSETTTSQAPKAGITLNDSTETIETLRPSPRGDGGDSSSEEGESDSGSSDEGSKHSTSHSGDGSTSSDDESGSDRTTSSDDEDDETPGQQGKDSNSSGSSPVKEIPVKRLSAPNLGNKKIDSGSESDSASSGSDSEPASPRSDTATATSTPPSTPTPTALEPALQDNHTPPDSNHSSPAESPAKSDSSSPTEESSTTGSISSDNGGNSPGSSISSPNTHTATEDALEDAYLFGQNFLNELDKGNLGTVAASANGSGSASPFAPKAYPQPTRTNLAGKEDHTNGPKKPAIHNISYIPLIAKALISACCLVTTALEITRTITKYSGISVLNNPIAQGVTAFVASIAAVIAIAATPKSYKRTTFNFLAATSLGSIGYEMYKGADLRSMFNLESAVGASILPAIGLLTTCYKYATQTSEGHSK